MTLPRPGTGLPARPAPRPVAILVFDGIQILDVTGPAAVFAAANDAAGYPYYQVHILSARGGPVQSNCVVSIHTDALSTMPVDAIDTLLFSGGDDDAVLNAAAEAPVRDGVLRAQASCRRLGSICSGALAMGQLGLLDGKRAATHWSACDKLARLFPLVEVDTNAVYVEDGRAWTSAGVTTGIDMCLEMVARDLGSGVANTIAKRLVIHARRPSYQAQISEVIAAQEKADPDFSVLIGRIKANLAGVLDVQALAASVAMSPRTFHRKFTASVGETPARFVETLRLEQGKGLLSSELAIKHIAVQCGYADVAQFSKAFQRRFGLAPQAFRAGMAQG